MDQQAEGCGMTAPTTYLRQLREGATRRRLELTKLLRDDPTATNVALAKVLGVNRDTIAEDRKFLMSQATNEAQSEMQLYREDQLARIADKWEQIESDDSMSGAEKHLAWSRWMKLEMDLRGTAAPTRSESLNVNADAENIGPYRKFVLAAQGLDELQIDQLLLMARELPRKPFVMAQPPKNSPLWSKTPKQLEGDGL
jgi:hypothetical protein